MRFWHLFAVLLCLLPIAAGCSSLPGSAPAGTTGSTESVGQIVQATFAAMTAQPESTSQPAVTSVPATATSATGSISGSLNYPADSLPPMYVTAYQVGTQSYQYVITSKGQGTYEIDALPPGTYHIVAYTVGGGGFPAELAGGFTKAVQCGLTADCTDHSLVDVPLSAGQSVTGVNPADWYAPDGTFPAFPQSHP